MRIPSSTMLCVTVAALLAAAPHSQRFASAEDSWPQWRGNQQNGVASGTAFPQSWSKDEGIAWNIELPGRGGSTPVIDSGAAYLTTGVDGKNHLMAYDLATGDQKWATAIGTDRGNKHKKGSGSNPSAVIDSDHIYAYFRSGDLACVDRGGNVKWHVNLQDMYGEDTLWWDLGSSPTVTSNAVVVAVMQTGPSYLVAFDKNNGDVLWKTDRMLGAPEEAAQSYSTPLVTEINGTESVVVMGADHLTIHRASDGKELGRLGGFNPGAEKFFRSISSPVIDGNIVICPYARGATLTGVKMDDLVAGKGDSAIVWFRDDLGSDVPTPAAHNGRVYVVGDGKGASRGLISCLDAKTGTTVWSVSLPRSRQSYSSSPLVADDHLYVTDETGKTYVIGPLSASQPKVVAENSVEDVEQFTVASLVPADGGLLLRSRSHLYRISK